MADRHTVNAAVLLAPDQARRIAPTDELLAEVSSRTRSALERMLGELNLPGAPAVALTVEPGEVGHDWGIAIRLQGRPCRLDLQAAGQVDDDAGLARFVAETLFWNRELLVDDELVRIAVGIGAGGGRSDDADDVVARILRRIVRQGHDVTEVLAALDAQAGAAGFGPRAEALLDDVLSRLAPTALTVCLGPQQYDALLDENPPPEAAAEDDTLAAMVEMMRAGLFYELGVRFPAFDPVRDFSLGDREIRFRLNRLSAPAIEGLASDEFLVNATPARLAEIGVDARPAVNPANGNPAALATTGGGGQTLCLNAGATSWGPRGFFVLAASAVLRRHAPLVLTTDRTGWELGRLATAFPALVAAAVDRFGRRLLTLVLQHLLDEEIGIRDLRSVLERLLDARTPIDVETVKTIVLFPSEGGAVPAPAGSPVETWPATLLADHVRSGLQDYVTYRCAGGQGTTLVVILLDRRIEERLRDPAPLTDDERAELIAAVHAEVGAFPHTASRPVVLTGFEIRRRFRSVIELEFPRLAVLAYSEVSPAAQIQPIARIAGR